MLSASPGDRRDPLLEASDSGGGDPMAEEEEGLITSEPLSYGSNKRSYWANVGGKQKYEIIKKTTLNRLLFFYLRAVFKNVFNILLELRDLMDAFIHGVFYILLELI